MNSTDKLFLLDAYALIYRAYYAFIKNPRINSKGFNTSAILGFVNTLEEVLKKAEEEGSGDFVSVTLTDEEELYRPGERLQKAYEYLLEYRIENRRTRNFMEESEKDLKVEDPLSVFRTFYEEVQGVAPDEREEAFMSQILEKAREEI